MVIDFSTDELKKLEDRQKDLLQNLVDKIENWRTANGIPIQDPLDSTKRYVLSNEETAKFTKWLQDMISSETTFVPKKGKKLILYSGTTSSGTALYLELKDGDFLKKTVISIIFQILILVLFYGNHHTKQL